LVIGFYAEQVAYDLGRTGRHAAADLD